MLSQLWNGCKGVCRNFCPGPEISGPSKQLCYFLSKGLLLLLVLLELASLFLSVLLEQASLIFFFIILKPNMMLLFPCNLQAIHAFFPPSNPQAIHAAIITCTLMTM
jgi:hypothetical protein